MTEQEWLTTTDPIAMYRHLQAPSLTKRLIRLTRGIADGVSPRKMRLHGLGCDGYVGPIESEEGYSSPVEWRDMQSTEVNLRRLFADPRTHTRASALFRDVFGNPFRPVRLSTSWQTQTVLALADHPDVLAHCRGDGPHVRGCWVVDLVLGKS
jgi:hypothetical protein